VLATRAAKGMVLDDADPDTHSAGSFFQNAIVSESFARTLPPECPRWPVAPDIDPVTVIPLSAYDGVVPAPVGSSPDVKISAAWLIEQAGLPRGWGAEVTGGRATLSTKHTLALTNRGDATTADLLALARAVQERVDQRFGVRLVNEPVLVGCAL